MSQSFRCRLVKCLPCVAVYMSSLTIIGIAFDRHRVICKPTYRQVKRNRYKVRVLLILNADRKWYCSDSLSPDFGSVTNFLPASAPENKNLQHLRHHGNV